MTPSPTSVALSPFRRLGPSLALLIPGFWALLGIYALHSALPYNPMQLPLEKRLDLRTWFPQGWCFFTRSPREDRLLVLVRDPGGSFQPALSSQSAWPRSLGGFDRRERALWIEAGILFASVAPTNWQECKKAPAECLAETSEDVDVANPTPQPALCGEIGLVRQRVLPWAWAKSRSRLNMPSKVAVVNVTCAR